MFYRTLGRTDVKVSEISFGTIPILKGFKSYDEIMPKFFNLSMEESNNLLHMAFDEGINFYDTATYDEYADAEQKTGIAFRHSSLRSKVIIGSRARRYTYEEMYQAVEHSLEILGTDYADIFYIHQANPDNIALALDAEAGAIRALREHKQKGNIRFIGLASHYVEVFQKSLLVSDIDVYQFPQNIVENGFYPRLRFDVERHNIGAVAMKIYGAGPFAEIYDKALLISYPLHQLAVHSALIGIGTPQQLRENIIAYEQAITKQQSLKIKADEIIQDLKETGHCNRCQLCVCHLSIPVSHILRFRAYYYYYDLKSFSRDRYQKRSITADKCDKCGKCEEQCPLHLPIMEMLGDAHHILS